MCLEGQGLHSIDSPRHRPLWQISTVTPGLNRISTLALESESLAAFPDCRRADLNRRQESTDSGFEFGTIPSYWGRRNRPP